MTKNQKIALGCGGAGCLGLIVVVIAVCAIYFLGARRTYQASREYNFNVNLNSNTNGNSDTNTNSDRNDNSSGSNSNSASTLSNDDKHKLFQAASMTGDAELIRRVNVKLGILDEDFTPGDEYQRFASDHVTWAFRNTEFILSVNTPEKARAYVDAHFPE